MLTEKVKKKIPRSLPVYVTSILFIEIEKAIQIPLVFD